MKTMGAYQVKTLLSKVLDDVQQGEEIIITRKGKPIAIVKPFPEDRPSLLKQIEAFRRKHSIESRSITLDEIREFRTEGRK